MRFPNIVNYMFERNLVISYVMYTLLYRGINNTFRNINRDIFQYVSAITVWFVMLAAQYYV